MPEHRSSKFAGASDSSGEARSPRSSRQAPGASVERGASVADHNADLRRRWKAASTGREQFDVLVEALRRDEAKRRWFVDEEGEPQFAASPGAMQVEIKLTQREGVTECWTALPRDDQLLWNLMHILVTVYDSAAKECSWLRESR